MHIIGHLAMIPVPLKPRSQLRFGLDCAEKGVLETSNTAPVGPLPGMRSIRLPHKGSPIFGQEFSPVATERLAAFQTCSQTTVERIRSLPTPDMWMTNGALQATIASYH